MKITGTSGYLIFDLENGYKIKALGELLVRGFWVWTDTMKQWEPPHENEPVTQEQINAIILEAKKGNETNYAKLIFD